MIELLLFFTGILFFFLDIAIIPAISSYTMLIDLSLFYCFHLFEIKKEKSIPFFFFILLLKAVLVPVEILLPFILLYLTSILFYIGIVKVTKMDNIVTIGLPGFLFFTWEYFLFKKSNFNLYMISLLTQLILWIFLVPLLKAFSALYKEKIKEKGVFV